MSRTDAPFDTKPEPRYGVLVNEVLINCYTARGVADWWQLNRPYWETAGRLRTHVMSVAGDRVELGPLRRDDAEFAAEHMVASGVPKAAVKVRRWTETR
jgi:hypothetical protein